MRLANPFQNHHLYLRQASIYELYLEGKESHATAVFEFKEYEL